MKELRRCHQNIARTHQIKIRNDRFEVGVMNEVFARYNIGRVASRLLPRMLVHQIMEIFFRMLIGILIHIAKINLELFVIVLLQNRV